ncbi:MAG TPA: flavodoxin domain-containing protein [Microbacterium sp.]|nr:flavodoxin domain-containing protein [Microbacterium sp.]
MTIHVLFGTESGNAELVAEEIADSLRGDEEVDCSDLADADVNALGRGTLYLIVCSTHGEGDLPQSAVPFVEAMNADAPDLTGVRYAMLGLGDSTYPNYSRGSEHVDEALRARGAQRVGEYGRHDAAGREDPVEVGIDWAADVVAHAERQVTAA